MKYLLFSFLFIASQSFAGYVPNCWLKNTAKGQYIVSLETPKMRKDEVLAALAGIVTPNVQPKQYPNFSAAHVFIYAQAVDRGSGRRLSDEQLQVAAERQLAPLTDITGVSISCNYIRRPNPPRRRGTVPR